MPRPATLCVVMLVRGSNVMGSGAAGPSANVALQAQSYGVAPRPGFGVASQEILRSGT